MIKDDPAAGTNAICRMKRVDTGTQLSGGVWVRYFPRRLLFFPSSWPVDNIDIQYPRSWSAIEAIARTWQELQQLTKVRRSGFNCSGISSDFSFLSDFLHITAKSSIQWKLRQILQLLVGWEWKRLDKNVRLAPDEVIQPRSKISLDIWSWRIQACLKTGMHVGMQTCMHACMHNSKHADMPVFMHTCMQACLPACMDRCMHAYLHACLPACIHAWLQTCMYACTHACFHACMTASRHACLFVCFTTCMHGSMDACKHAFMLACLTTFLHAYLPVCMSECMHACMHEGMQPCSHADMHACLPARLPACMPCIRVVLPGENLHVNPIDWLIDWLMHACMHVCLPAYSHACMPAFLPACMAACLPACNHACMPVCIPAYRHACKQACNQSSRQAGMHGNTPACLHMQASRHAACMPACLKQASMLSWPACLSAWLPACLLACMSACRYPYLHTCTNLSVSLGKQKMKHFLMLNSNYYNSQLHNTAACCLFTYDGPIMQSGLQIPVFSLNNLSCALRALV